MIVIINYGLGNISSIVNMLQKCGCSPVVATEIRQMECAEKIILPGVGAFDYGMKRIYDEGWVDALNEAVIHHKIPVLGICLGMQMMCKSSEEGKLKGLGWIDAEVIRFKLSAPSLKVPHMGWNTVKVVKPNPLICVDDEEQRYYFVHSYHVVCNHHSDVVATAHYGYDFVAALSNENIFGLQFHPEKSHRFGMALLRKFVEM